MYLFNILHIPYSYYANPCTQVPCWIRGLTFELSKSPNHFLRNSFAVIILPLLPPLCFHMCLHSWLSTFHGPSQLVESRKYFTDPPREPVHGKGKRKANWNDFNAYYYCSHCSACHIIMPLFFSLLSFCFESTHFFVNCLGIAQAKPCQ